MGRARRSPFRRCFSYWPLEAFSLQRFPHPSIPGRFLSELRYPKQRRKRVKLYGLKPLADSVRRVRENTTLIVGGTMAKQLLMQDKTVLITGASSGVGLGCAFHMAEQGARVVMVCRDHMRGRTARAEVAKYAAGPDPLLFLADLSSQ